MADISFLEVVSAGKGWTTILADNGETYTFSGNRNWRNNNPGNINYGKFAKSQGAVGTDGRFAVFPSYSAGQKAREVLQFESPSYKDLTVAAAIERYAPSIENDVEAYIRAVTSTTGVSRDAKMSDLTPQQRAAFLAQQERHEGFRTGKIAGVEGKPVPASVVQQFKAVPLPAANIPNAPDAPNLPGRRPDTGAGPDPLPAPAPLSFGDGGLFKTPTAPTAPSKPTSGSAAVGLGVRSDASGSLTAFQAPTKPAVTGLGLTAAQVGQQADNGRLTGYRDIQEMGPSSKGAPATAQPTYSGAVKTTNGQAQTVAMPPDARPSSLPPAPETPNIPKYIVTTTKVPIGGSSAPTQAATDKLMDIHDKREAAQMAAQTKKDPAKPAPLEFKTVTKKVLNSDWVEQQRVIKARGQAQGIPGAMGAARGVVGIGAPAMGFVARPMSPAGLAASSPGINHSYAPVTAAGQRTDVHGNDMQFQPLSVQTSDRHNTGY